MRSYWCRVGLYCNIANVLIRREKKETHTQRMPCDDRGIDWSDSAGNQEMPRMDGHQDQVGRSQERFSPSVSEGAWPYSLEV